MTYREKEPGRLAPLPENVYKHRIFWYNIMVILNKFRRLL